MVKLGKVKVMPSMARTSPPPPEKNLLPLWEQLSTTFNCATEVTHGTTPRCSNQLSATDNGVRDGKSNLLVVIPPPFIVHYTLCMSAYCREQVISINATAIKPIICTAEHNGICFAYAAS